MVENTSNHLNTDLGTATKSATLKLFRVGLLCDQPGAFLQSLMKCSEFLELFPEISVLYRTPQEPEFHPEGNVGVHTEMVLDVAKSLIAEYGNGLTEDERLTIMLACLCHDLGKPATTQVESGRIRQNGHAEAGLLPTGSFLDKLGLTEGHQGYPFRQYVLALVEHHLQPGQLGRLREAVRDRSYRRLVRKTPLVLLYLVAKADALGRGVGGRLPGIGLDGNAFDANHEEFFFYRARSLSVGPEPIIAPLLTGQHLIEMGLQPGGQLGAIKDEVYQAQLDGNITSLEEAKDCARVLIERARHNARLILEEAARFGHFPGAGDDA